MVRINFEIEEVENGWIIYDSYDGKKFAKTFKEAEKILKKKITNFKKCEELK